jgi:tetratricopeptide (TPR) repeat protein
LPSVKEADRRQQMQARALLLRERGDLDGAQAVYDAYLTAEPNNPEVLYEAAMLAEKRNDMAGMEAKLRRAIAQKPDFAAAYNALGYSLADRNERLAEAKALIDSALKITPNDGMMIDSLGWVLYRLGQKDAALRELKRAYALTPDAEIAAHLGEVLAEIGQREEAERVLREALKTGKDNEVLQKTLKKYGF